MKPIYDALKKAPGSEKVSKARARITQRIEIAPLAYMRGRTLENSWIIADEMQNATASQMKMLLTRIGEGSKLIVNGDLSQCDVQENGLEDFLYKLKEYGDTEHIDFIELEAGDIVRHDAVIEVLEIYKGL